MAKWADLERRASFLRKELELVRNAMADITQSPDGGDLDRLDHLRKIEALRAAELLTVEKQFAGRRF